MPFPLLGIAKSLIGGGPLVGELIKLDKEAQRDLALGMKWALILLAVFIGSPLCYIGFVLGAGLGKLIF